MAKPQYSGPWRRIRKAILERDGYQCQIRGKHCTGVATQVDHIVATSKGGAWFDPANLRASCAKCNNLRVDRTQRDAWRYADTEIVLVVGPPGAQHLTHVEQHKQPADLVIDYEQIASAVGNHPALHQATMAARNALLEQARRAKINAPRIWITSTNPEAEKVFPYHRVVVLDVDRGVALAAVPDHQRHLVDEWFAKRVSSVGGSSSRVW